MYGARTNLFVSLQQIRSHSLLLSASFARDQRVQHSVRSLRWQPTCSYVACRELVWASMINSSLSPKRHVSGNKTSTVQKTCAATYSSLKRSEYFNDRLALQESDRKEVCPCASRGEDRHQQRDWTTVYPTTGRHPQLIIIIIMAPWYIFIYFF